MKKSYLKPTAEIVRIGIQQPIAASGITFDGETGSGFLNDEFGEDALSREFVF